MRLNEGLTALGSANDEYGIFQGSALTEVILPSTMQVLGVQAFCNCEQLRRITLPLGLKEIKPRCFWNTGLERIAIPKSVVRICEGTFYGCVWLEEVQIERTDKIAVGKSAFGKTP